MKRVYLLLFFTAPFFSIAQNLSLRTRGTGALPEKTACLTEHKRQEIMNKLKLSVADLESRGILSTKSQRQAATTFQFPLRQSAGYNDPGFYLTTYLVDHNSQYPDKVLDYNCRGRSYDRADGYNHQGTDYLLFPFGWNKMMNNAVEIVAAAPGVIIYKNDGLPDQNCVNCPGCDWNAVYVRHPDNSTTWYGHMKQEVLQPRLLVSR